MSSTSAWSTTIGWTALLLALLQPSTAVASSSPTINLGRIYVDELFTTKIEPQMFNWTAFGQPEHFQYRASLRGYPDLPGWMRFMFSEEYAAGYLYGTAPARLARQEVKIDIVALNRLSYETKRLTLSYSVASRNMSGPVNTVHMKVDNLNWVHLMDPGRVENLKNIFRNDLWPETKDSLHIVFMDSAIAMGGRRPLRPQQMEGVIIYLGSTQPFSGRLIDLQEEIRPLYKLTTCSYKRTTVQTIFETAGFKMDWCAFRIVEGGTSAAAASASPGGTSITATTDPKAPLSDTNGRSLLSDHQLDSAGFHRHVPEQILAIQKAERWEPMYRSEAPQRNYIDELALVIAIPGLLLTMFVAVLAIVLCFYHEKLEPLVCHRPTVQMVQYSDENSAHPAITTTTLKSLKEPARRLIEDDGNCSIRSNSSFNSLRGIDQLHTSPRATASSTIRPRPPPYKPPATKSYTMPRMEAISKQPDRAI